MRRSLLAGVIGEVIELVTGDYREETCYHLVRSLTRRHVDATTSAFFGKCLRDCESRACRKVQAEPFAAGSVSIPSKEINSNCYCSPHRRPNSGPVHERMLNYRRDRRLLPLCLGISTCIIVDSLPCHPSWLSTMSCSTRTSPQKPAAPKFNTQKGRLKYNVRHIFTADSNVFTLVGAQ
jgi:hypothetical protein